MSNIRTNTYFSRRELFFHRDTVYRLLAPSLNEDGSALVPRFSIKAAKEIAGIPVNKPMKYSDELFVKAIEYGMILLISYKGAKDKWKGGRERTIYPMVLGVNAKGTKLLRGFHLKGWSVSRHGPVDKVWRMFRPDRIKSVTFTGSFFRLPPDGYVANDSAMTSRIIRAADFTSIRTNQERLVKRGEIKADEDTAMSGPRLVFKIKAQKTDGELDLDKPFDSGYFTRNDAGDVLLTFVKSLIGNDRYVVIGARGHEGNTVRIHDENKQVIGTFKVTDSMKASELAEGRPVPGGKKWPILVYGGKM